MRIFILLTSLILIQNCRIYPGLDNRTSIPINPISLMYRIFNGRLPTGSNYVNWLYRIFNGRLSTGSDYYVNWLFEVTKINQIHSTQPNNPTDNKDKDIRNLEDFIDVIKETPSSVCPKIAEFKLALLTEVDDWRMSDKTWKYILPQQIVRNIFLKPDFNVENPNLPEKMKNFIKQYKYNRTQYLKDLKVEEGNPTEINDTLEKKKGTIDPYEEDYKNYDSNVSFVFKYDFNDEQRSFYYKKNDSKNTYFKEYQESCSRRKDIIKGNDQSKENDRIDKAMSNNLFYKKSLYRKEKVKAIWGEGNWTIHLFIFFNWINDLCFNTDINIEKDTYILKLDDMYKDFIDDDLRKRRESIFQKYESSIPINLEYLMLSIFKGRILYSNYHYLGRLFEAEKINKINSIQPNNPMDNKDKDIRNLEDFIDVIKETKCSVSPKIAEFKLALLTEVDDWRSVRDPWGYGPRDDTIWEYILPQQVVRRIFLQKTFDVENSNLPQNMKDFINQYKYNRTQYLENLKTKKEVFRVYDYYENPIKKDDTLEEKMDTIDLYKKDYENYDLNNITSLFYDERSFYYKKNDPKNDFYKVSWGLVSSPFEEYKKSCSRRKDIIKGNDQSKENDRIDKAMSNNLFYKKSLYRKEKLKAIYEEKNWNTHLFTFFNWINDLCFNINIESSVNTPNGYKYILKLDDMYKGFIDDDFIDDDLKKRCESIFQKYEDFFK